MAYVKNTWVDREGTTRYHETVDEDGALIFTPDYEKVTEIGTPVNADNMNHIEEGIAAGSFTKYDSMATYAKDDLVTAIVDNELKVYRSLQDNNTNALDNSSFWDKVEFSGGAGSYVGQTVFSLDPLYEDGLHLFDGSVIDGAGIYAGFVNTYIANLYSKHPERFISESEWQTAVNTYGVCGRYVYNQSANTVRLPKVTGFVEGTLDVNALGDLVEAGLPNITGTLKVVDRGSSASTDPATGAFYKEGTWSAAVAGGNSDTWGGVYSLDASRSSSIYNNSDTVQPQAIKGYMYIVVATGTKTDIDVDIDNIVTDLNSKVDVSNMVEVPTIVETYVNGTSWYRVWSDGWCEQGGYLSSTSDSEVTVSFLKNFIDTNYSFQRTNYSNHNSTAVGAYYNSYWNKTTNSVTVLTHTNFINGGVTWEAKGYIA